MLTQERLKELLDYDAETGVFTRLTNQNGARAGDIAGSFAGHRYQRLSVDGHQYYGHHLAWFYTHGQWPEMLDHVDRNTANNAMTNLRECTSPQNQANRDCRKGYQRNGDGWQATIMSGGRRFCLGTFASEAAARAAYEDAWRKRYEESFPTLGRLTASP